MVKSLIDVVIDKINDNDLINRCMKFVLKTTGPLLVIGFYVIIIVHFHTYFFHVMKVLPKRLGVEFAYLWAAIGLILVYNIVYNHLLATLIKPGSPRDLRKIELLRCDSKQRANRKSVLN